MECMNFIQNSFLQHTKKTFTISCLLHAFRFEQRIRQRSEIGIGIWKTLQSSESSTECEHQQNEKVFSIKRRLAVIWPKSPYICKTHLDHAHLHNAKNWLRPFKLIRFPFIDFAQSSSYRILCSALLCFACSQPAKKPSPLRFVFRSHNLLAIQHHSIWFDLLNRCSLLVQLLCELLNEIGSDISIWHSKFDGLFRLYSVLKRKNAFFGIVIGVVVCVV